MYTDIWKQNFTNTSDLLSFCQIDLEKALLSPDFPCNVPKRIAEKIEKGNSDDPLFLQFVPQRAEQIHTEGFTLDPLEEEQAQITPCLLQKYQGRALLITCPSCCMHCRFCFRRHFSYQTTTFTEELAWLEQHDEIEEVILSGGDPLSLSTPALSKLFERLNCIDHLQRIRLHSRFPIGIPERIDQELLELFSQCPKQIIFVLHINHPRELDEEVASRLSLLQRAGIPILSQTVLLKGVNDSLETLQELMRTLSNNAIIPYYLHQLDPVDGVSHFHVLDERAKTIVTELHKTLSGYMVPRLVQELPGKSAKQPLLLPEV